MPVDSDSRLIGSFILFCVMIVIIAVCVFGWHDYHSRFKPQQDRIAAGYSLKVGKPRPVCVWDSASGGHIYDVCP